MCTEAPLLRTACDRCHKRKQRCLRSSPENEDDPCRRCKEAGEKCVFSPPCRLGRPTNKLKQQRQEQGGDYSSQKIKVTSSSHTPCTPSQLHLLRSQSLECSKKKSRPQTLYAVSRHNNRQPGRPGRPRRSQPPPSMPPVDSPFSTTSAPNILDGTISSTASVISSAPSLDVLSDYLRDSTLSLQEVQFAPIQHRTQQPCCTYPTSVPQELYLPPSEHHSISAQTAKLDSTHSMWNAPQEVPYGVHDGYPVGNVLSHNNDALSYMPPAHSGILQQPHGTISPRQQIHMIDQVTLPSNDTSMSMSHRQRFERGNLSHPLTPPPFLPAGHVECIEDQASNPMHPGFMYSQVDAHHARNPWLNEVGAQYHAVYGKLTENPLITPATLAQNYQLQLQLTSTGNVNDMPDDWPRTPIYC